MATVTKGGKQKDPFLEKWYVERGWVEFGANQVDEELELYRQLGETRDFTRDEYDTIKELQRRKETLTNDLHYVYNNEGGDFDAVIDEKGQSLNERWGIDPSENAGVMDFLKMLKDNPTYTLGLFTSEMIKDLPLSVLAYVGLTSKTVGGASALNTAVRTLNKIEPKIMRGIAKMSTGVGASALAGAGYEAAYTYGTQGDVKGERVKTGAKFGAAFGILAGLGLLRSKGGLTTAETKTTAKTSEKPNTSDEVELEKVTEKVLPTPQRKKILDAAQDLAEGRTTMGMKRMLGMTTASAFGFGMFSATKDLFDYTEEELDAIRILGPDYQANSQPIFLPRGEANEIKFIDAQAILPNEAIWKPIRSLILQGDPKDEGYLDGIESAIFEVLSPAISKDATAKLIHELMTNRREGSDQPIYYWDQDLNPLENALNNIPDLGLSLIHI